MRGVAEQLGVAVMSLYRHVPGKDELVELMLDTALGDPPAPDPRATWRTQLIRWARANLDLYRRHPWLLEAVVSRPPIGPNRLSWFDAALQAVAALGIGTRQRVSVVVLVDSYVRGAAQLAVSVHRPAKGARIAAAEWATLYSRVLRRVVTEQSYPALAKLVTAGFFDKPDPRTDDFEFGLRRVLDGIEARKPKARGRARARRPVVR